MGEDSPSQETTKKVERDVSVQKELRISQNPSLRKREKAYISLMTRGLKFEEMEDGSLELSDKKLQRQLYDLTHRTNESGEKELIEFDQIVDYLNVSQPGLYSDISKICKNPIKKSSLGLAVNAVNQDFVGRVINTQNKYNCLEFATTVSIVAKLFYKGEVEANVMGFTRGKEGEKGSTRHFMLYTVVQGENGKAEHRRTAFGGNTRKITDEEHEPNSSNKRYTIENIQRGQESMRGFVPSPTFA